MGWGWLDHVPIVSNVKGAVQGDWKQAAGGNLYEGAKYLKDHEGDIRGRLGYGNATQQPTADQGSANDPNVAFQARQNYQTGQRLLGNLDAAQSEHNQALAGQNRFLTQLDNTINNPNASSVAQTQNVMANDASARQQLGAAAGVGGPNAFAARRQALQAIGQGNVGTNQTAALLRAQETANAQQQKGGLLGQMSGAADRSYGMNLQGAHGFAGLAERGQESQQGLNKKIEDENRDRDRAWNGKLIEGGTKLLGML